MTDDKLSIFSLPCLQNWSYDVFQLKNITLSANKSLTLKEESYLGLFFYFKVIADSQELTFHVEIDNFSLENKISDYVGISDNNDIYAATKGSDYYLRYNGILPIKNDIKIFLKNTTASSISIKLCNVLLIRYDKNLFTEETCSYSVCKLTNNYYKSISKINNKQIIKTEEF